MSKKSRSTKASQQEKDVVSPTHKKEMDTMTMGDMSLEKAERLHNVQPTRGLI